MDLKILLRKIGARLIFKISRKSLHIDPGNLPLFFFFPANLEGSLDFS
jgi:hypothetical protein